MGINWRLLLNSARSTYFWFTFKFLLGIVVTYAVANWIKFSSDGVTFFWAVYVVGAGAYALLFLSSDLRDDYRRRTGYRSGRERKRRRRN